MPEQLLDTRRLPPHEITKINHPELSQLFTPDEFGVIPYESKIKLESTPQSYKNPEFMHHLYRLVDWIDHEINYEMKFESSGGRVIGMKYPKDEVTGQQNRYVDNLSLIGRNEEYGGETVFAFPMMGSRPLMEKAKVVLDKTKIVPAWINSRVGTGDATIEVKRKLDPQLLDKNKTVIWCDDVADSLSTIGALAAERNKARNSGKLDGLYKSTLEQINTLTTGEDKISFSDERFGLVFDQMAQMLKAEKIVLAPLYNKNSPATVKIMDLANSDGNSGWSKAQKQAINAMVEIGENEWIMGGAGDGDESMLDTSILGNSEKKENIWKYIPKEYQEVLTKAGLEKEFSGLMLRIGGGIEDLVVFNPDHPEKRKEAYQELVKSVADVVTSYVRYAKLTRILKPLDYVPQYLQLAKGIEPKLGLTFADVLVEPHHSQAESRKDLPTNSLLVPEIELKAPIVSANMDTVTESEMAEAMASLGGIGIIHRFMPIERQVAEVKKVKERTRTFEDRPITVQPDTSVADVLALLEIQKRGYVMVQDVEGNILGMATDKDFKAALSKTDTIASVMKARKDLITAPEGTTLKEAVQIMLLMRIEKLPIFNTEGKLVGVYTTKDFQLLNKFPNASRDSTGRLLVGAAIGVKNKQNEIERALRLIDAGVDVLVLDIAHGDSDHAVEMLYELLVKNNIKTPIIAGNVATADATQLLIDMGAKGIKVGIGPGYACDTRVKAGAGKPQLTAVAECAAIAIPQGIMIIADGGMRTSGDLVKVFVAGADTGMFGGILAGTQESPGEVITKEGGAQYKRYHGMASATAYLRRLQMEQGADAKLPDDYVAEGRELEIPFRGSVMTRLNKLIGGLQSGMSYIGANTVRELREKGNFVRMTANGAQEQFGEID